MARVLGAIRTWCTEGPAWPLSAYLVLGFLLRLPAVLLADGYAFLDQQFQYVDPAWHLASGDAWHRTWEWIDGIRSWVYPGFLAGVFRLGSWLGFRDPMALMVFTRGLHALVSLLPLAMFWLLVVRWRPLPRPRLALLLVAASGIGVHVAVQPAGPNMATVLSVAAVFAFLGPRLFPLLAGILLGLAFCCRVQDALLGPVIVVAGALQRRWPATVLFALGCLPGILLQGFVDLSTWGTFLHSPFAYLEVNLIGGAAAKWRTRPWWWYVAVVVVPLLGLVPPLLGAAWQAMRRGSRHAALPVFAAVCYLALHTCIERKAVRFVWPALWLLVAACAVGATTSGGESWAVRWHRRWLVCGQFGLLLWACVVSTIVGPARAAAALGGEPTFRSDLVVVDGDVASIGGFYYLRRQGLQVHGVGRAEVGALLAALPASPDHWLMAVHAPLQGSEVGPGWRLVEAGAFTGRFDLRPRERRYLYRVVRE
jgi:hypothetical protein